MVERYKTNTNLKINLYNKKHNTEFIYYLSLKILLMPNVGSYQGGFSTPLKKKKMSYSILRHM